MDAQDIKAVAALYLARPPERLVLEGYRHWTHGLSQRSPDRVEALATLYDAALGPRDAGPVLSAFQDFICIAGLCARCPLRMMASGCVGLCRDEALILGIVSGLQHDDNEATAVCLRAIAHPARADQMAFSAGAYAFLLRGRGLTLMPIPTGALEGVLSPNRHPDAAEMRSGTTLH
ncbi:hypothetical protein DFR52_102631 [Hoeflea marina]|uniref:Uncharacterized protein n=1 Tax=Hoeflea marina TaxID=274592 RepID=A0A317PMI5_9HYPH|nr:hypothetical protein [Hoeflea marina]PWW01966.1 hypothetical protein DFR52_102631 [Hoeflea marina]